MTIKLGTDICSIARISAAYEKFGAKFLKRILTQAEIDYVQRDTLHFIPRLAGRFAAKEATAKALGTGWRGLDWKEVEITHSPSGEPALELYGRALRIAESRGLKHFEVSISHEREFAVATVIAYAPH